MNLRRPSFYARYAELPSGRIILPLTPYGQLHHPAETVIRLHHPAETIIRLHHSAAPAQGSRIPRPYRSSEITMPGGSRIRQHVADIPHAGQIHDAALKAETEARMPRCPVFSEVQIIAVL